MTNKSMKRLLFSFISILTIFGCSSNKEYKLEQVIIASRHNVRAPLQSNINKMNALVRDTTIWMDWPNRKGELTPRGAAAEQKFGEYFKEWMQKESFYSNIQKPEDVYFAASPRQRTVESAKEFAKGLGITVSVVNDGLTSGEDRNFLPLLNDDLDGFDTLAFQKEAKKEMLEILTGKQAKLSEAYKLLEELIANKHLSPADTCIRFRFYEKNGTAIKEPTAYRDLKAANRISDALILQFYEGTDDDFTTLGITEKEIEKWRLLAEIKDCYSDILFTEPIVAVNVSHGFLNNMYEQVKTGKKLIFLSTHDTTLAALFVALQLEPYDIPAQQSIESVTPVGVKFVIEKYSCGNKSFAKLRLLYQTSDQIRSLQASDNTPAIIDISIKCLEKNSDGYYDWAVIEKHIENTLDAFAKTAKGEKPF